jgi:hypothetical protein
LARTLVPVAVTAPVTTAGIPLASQKLADLGGQGTLEHAPSAVSDQPLEGCADLVFGLGVDYARDVIVCFHRAFLHWLTGKVNREGTPLFMSAPGAPLASEFPHITTLAQHRQSDVNKAAEERAGITSCAARGEGVASLRLSAAPVHVSAHHSRREMDLLIVLAPLAQSTVSIPPVSVSPTLITDTLSRLLVIVPLIAGYLLAREGKGKLVWEISAVLMLVLATVTIGEANITAENLPKIINLFIGRLPVALLLLGLAFVRDGGLKMVIGLLLMVVSGLLLPRMV